MKCSGSHVWGNQSFFGNARKGQFHVDDDQDISIAGRSSCSRGEPHEHPFPLAGATSSIPMEGPSARGDTRGHPTFSYILNRRRDREWTLLDSKEQCYPIFSPHSRVQPLPSRGVLFPSGLTTRPLLQLRFRKCIYDLINLLIFKTGIECHY